jgi:uncharacterized protein (DUF111 family)
VKIAYFDCPSGAAGDMIMAALVDAGAPLGRLRDALQTLPLSGWQLDVRQTMKGAFRATKVDVIVDRSAHHPHRSLADVRTIVDQSALAPSIKADVLRVFTRLADAEARAHGQTRETVHFHDVGAVDAIVDVVGAVVSLSLLGVERVH